MYMARTVDIYNNRTQLFDIPRNGNTNKVQLTDSKLLNLLGMKFFRPKAQEYVPNNEDFPALVSKKPFKNPLDYKNFLIKERDTIAKCTDKVISKVCDEIDYVYDIKWGDAAMEEDEL